MNAKQIIAFGAVMLFVVCLLPAVDADTSITDSPRGTIEFDSMNGGDITFTVDSDTSFEMQVSVINESGGATVYTGTYQIHSGENVVTIHFEGLGEGDYYLNVVCSGPSGEFNGPNSFHVNVHVNQNILSNWATYAVIIVVVIVIAIFAYLKLRDNPKDKPQMTFEELEAQRKAEMAEKAEKRQKKEKPASTGTERKRYIGGGEKKAEPKEPAKEKPVKEKKVKEEKPKMTFEELEAQKQAEKAAKAEKKKKEKPTSTGLTERERYLAEKRKKKEQE